MVSRRVVLTFPVAKVRWAVASSPIGRRRSRRGEGAVGSAIHRGRVPVNPRLSLLDSSRCHGHAPARHQHVSVDHSARVHYQVAVDDRERPVDRPCDVHVAAVGRDLAAQHAASRDRDPAGEPDTQRIVVVRQQLGEDIRREGTSFGRIGDRSVGIDDDDAVLGKRGGGQLKACQKRCENRHREHSGE